MKTPLRVVLCRSPCVILPNAYTSPPESGPIRRHKGSFADYLSLILVRVALDSSFNDALGILESQGRPGLEFRLEVGRVSGSAEAAQGPCVPQEPTTPQ